jgi:hypothetical protein
MRSNYLCCLFLVTAVGFSQTGPSKTIEGKVVSAEGDVAATHVMNISTNSATITNISGFFAIRVHLNDTLVFSAVQFKKKELVVTAELMDSTLVSVPLEDQLTELDEVVVTPYNLTGDIAKDILTLKMDPVVTAESLGLPNAHVRIPTKSERELYEATSGGGLLPVTPILNAISGRTKMLKDRVARNTLYDRTERVRDFYADSLYRTKLRIPEVKIDDFLYFCEIDMEFQSLVDAHDVLRIWSYMEKRSMAYRKNNNLE